MGEDTEELRTGEVKYIKMSKCAAEEFLNFGVWELNWFAIGQLLINLFAASLNGMKKEYKVNKNMQLISLYNLTKQLHFFYSFLEEAFKTRGSLGSKAVAANQAREWSRRGRGQPGRSWRWIPLRQDSCKGEERVWWRRPGRRRGGRGGGGGAGEKRERQQCRGQAQAPAESTAKNICS